jgi:hypothetical protein
MLYRSDDPTQSIDYANFYLKEDFNCVEKPHGNLDANDEEAESSAKIYSYKNQSVQLKFMLSQKHLYCYILESLQYINVRDYDRQEVQCSNPDEVYNHDR